MVKATLGLKEIPKPDDAADGLAIALAPCTACQKSNREYTILNKYTNNKAATFVYLRLIRIFGNTI